MAGATKEGKTGTTGSATTLRILNVVERVILLLLAIPVIFIIADAIVRALDIGLEKGFVDFIVNAEDNLTPDFLDSIFTDPFTIGILDVQTSLLNLLFYGVLVLATVFAFRLIRYLVARS